VCYGRAATLRVSPVVRLGWLLRHRGCSRPRAPSPSSEEGDPSGLMGSSCELLSCVDAPSASLHSYKVSSHTKRGISTRGTPALATWRARKLGAARRGHVRFLVNTQCVGAPAVHAALLLAAPPALSHRLHALHAPLSSDSVYDVRRLTYDGTGADVTRRHTRGAYADSLEPGGSAARAIGLCGKGSSCQRWY
jgi:hypothetical protein